jgi:hypothetical protein
MILLEIFKFGHIKSSSKMLKIMVPESLDYKNAFDEPLGKYTTSYTLVKLKTVDMGSLFELVYSITMKDNLDEKVLLDALRCRNGNLNITLVMSAPKGEF